jgi:L-ascorbate metabolism protein UlaG (beta-lactamase superfamily)
MKVTKYEHACLVIEQDGRHLVIDPGKFASSLDQVRDVDAIVITHDHFDHYDEKNFQAVLDHSPDATVFVAQELVGKVENLAKNVVLASNQAEHDAGPFRLKFFGETHAPIHDDLAAGTSIHNFGVLVNGTLYYPGDSFYDPQVPVKVLAVPTSGPWMKPGEAIDFLKAIKPELAFPTHNAMNSEAGEGLAADLLTGTMKAWGGTYKPVNPGDTFDV